MAKQKREFIEVESSTKKAVVSAAKRQGMPLKQFSSLLLDHALAELRAKAVIVAAPSIITTDTTTP